MRVRSKVVHVPEPERKQRLKLFVGIRLAAFYPEGTIVEDSHGVRWKSWRPDSYATMDLPPGWLEIMENE